jgi:anti-sigma B factor antagonist
MPRHSPGGLKACPAGQTGGCDAYASCGNHHGVSLLEISVAAGEAGPVLTLSGEADLTTVAELTEALTAQLAIGARHLTVGLSRLRFADSAVIRALVLADRTLKQRGGGLVLAHPQPVVARALSLLGVDQAIEIRDGMSARADPDR